jgi:hypothetical protein
MSLCQIEMFLLIKYEIQNLLEKNNTDNNMDILNV